MGLRGCSENKSQGHTWEGHGPLRKCKKCKLEAPHVTDNIPDGEKKWTEARKKEQ